MQSSPDIGCRTGAAQINLSARGSRGADRTHIVLRSWSSAKKTHLLSMLAQPWQHTALYLLFSAWHTINLLHMKILVAPHTSTSHFCTHRPRSSVRPHLHLPSARNDRSRLHMLKPSGIVSSCSRVTQRTSFTLVPHWPPQHKSSTPYCILSCVTDYDCRRTPLQ